MSEKFYKIKGYEDYLISKSGKIYSIIKRRLLKPYDANGYYKVYLKDKRLNKCVSVFLHRLIAIQFIPNPRNLPVVNHKDGNKKNNSIYNLEWCTEEYNHRHALETGLLRVKGEDNPRAKLTVEQVQEIYKFYFDRKYNKKQISRLFNVSDALIGEIVRGVRWSEVYERYFGKPSIYKKPKRKHLRKEQYREILYDYYYNKLNTVQLAAKYNITNSYAGKIVNFRELSSKFINILKEIYKTLDNQQPSSCN